MSGTVVHKASLAAVDAVLERFHAAGIDAMAVDFPNAIARLISFGTYRVRIVVPEEQAAEARRVLAEWDREAVSKIGDLTSQARRQFAWATLVALLAAAGLMLLEAGRRQAHWLPLFALLVWFACLIVFGLLQRKRARAAEDEGPTDAP